MFVTTKNVLVSLETETRKMSITFVDSFRTLLIEYWNRKHTRALPRCWFIDSEHYCTDYWGTDSFSLPILYWRASRLWFTVLVTTGWKYDGLSCLTELRWHSDFISLSYSGFLPLLSEKHYTFRGLRPVHVISGNT